MSDETIIQALVELRRAVEGGGERFRRLLYAGLVLLVLGLAAFIAQATVTLGNREILDLVKSATTPGGEIYERSQANQARALTIIDCNNRRIVAHLPALENPGDCLNQTPADVYPGP